MKALIGTAFNAPKVTAVRYDGGQTAEELEKALVSWQASGPAHRLISGGEITNLAEAWCYGTTFKPQARGCRARGEGNFPLATKEDYARLKTMSLHDVKAEQIAREDAANSKGKKAQRQCHYEQDDWRPDEIYLLAPVRGQMEWCRLTSKGQWLSIMPEKPQIEEEPPAKKRKTRSKKGKPADDAVDQVVEDDAPASEIGQTTVDGSEVVAEGVCKMADEPDIELPVDYEE